MAPHWILPASSEAGLLPLQIMQRRGAERPDAYLKSAEDILNGHDDCGRRLR